MSTKNGALEHLGQSKDEERNRSSFVLIVLVSFIQMDNHD